MGNVVFRKTARNYNPDVAKAARITIVEAENMVETGEIEPDLSPSSHVYVKRVVKVERPKINVTIEKSYVVLIVSNYLGGIKWPKKFEGIARELIALRIANEIPDGSYANLGIGIPTLVSNWIEGRDIVLEAEVGMLNTGPLAYDEEIDQD